MKRNAIATMMLVILNLFFCDFIRLVLLGYVLARFKEMKRFARPQSETG